MKRNFLKISTILSAMLIIASCQKEVEPENTGNNGNNNNDGDKQEQIGESTTLEISAEGQWTDADVLGVYIPAAQVINKAASFENGKFKTTVATPAKDDMLYAYLPFTPNTSDGKLNVSLPSTVTGNDGTVKAKVASPVSLGEITDPMSINMTMRDVTGTIQFNISDASEGGKLAGQTITSLIITSETNIAGSATVDIQTGNAVVSEVSKTVTITPTTGTALGSQAVSLSISALPGTYTGTITLTTSQTAYEYPLNATVTAGQIAAVELDCTAEEYKGIQSADDWNAFIQGVIDGSYERFVNPETNAVELAASFSSDETLSYPGTTENASIEFNGTFDGKGYEITCNKFTRPLFNVLGKDAVVKNLIVRGTYTEMMNSGVCGNAVIAKVNKGTIENVTSYVETELNVASGVVFGAICGQNGGTLKNCKNYGNMTITSSASDKFGFYGGGIAALGHTVSGEPISTALNIDETCRPGQFINCENHGNIILTAVSGKGIRQGYGGICGLVYMNGVTFNGCKNTGNISRISNGEASNNFSASVGGILGRSAAWYTTDTGDSGAFDDGLNDDLSETGNGYDTQYTNCSNTGTLYCTCRHSAGLTYNNRVRRSDNIGGIVGLAVGANGKTQTITGCTNTGTLKGGWSYDTNAASLGGIAGYATYTEVSNCTAKCSLESIDNTKAIGAAGGLIGYVVKNVSITNNCISVPTMNIYGKNTTNFLYGLVFGNINISASIESASVAGSIRHGIAKGEQTEITITSENYTDYLVSANSNAKLTSPVTSWNSAQ